MTASREEDQQRTYGEGDNPVTDTPMVEMDRGGLKLGNKEGNGAQPYVPGWRYIFTDTILKNERERVD